MRDRAETKAAANRPESETLMPPGDTRSVDPTTPDSATPDPTNPDPKTPNPALCPLCGGPNGCAVTEGRPIETCWCLTARIRAEVLERIPPERRRQACVCARCAAGEP